MRKIPVRYARAAHAEALARRALDSKGPRVPDAPVHPAMQEATAELERQASEAALSRSRSRGGGGGGSGSGAHGAPGMYSPGSASADTAATTLTAQSTAELELAPQRWKEHVFREELNDFYSRYENQSWKNVISVGDSVFERDATRAVISQRPSKLRRCRTKTAKMLDEPTIEELIRQVKVLHDGISLIVNYDGNLDIEINEKDIDFDMDVIEKLVADSDS